NGIGVEYTFSLQAASRHTSERFSRLLLEKGADANTIEGGNDTALSTAAYCGREAIVRLLLEKGADI
ncbi:hypothetical protein FN846DRAFT_753955, partial [Sphaerosporella brunnea]